MSRAFELLTKESVNDNILHIAYRQTLCYLKESLVGSSVGKREKKIKPLSYLGVAISAGVGATPPHPQGAILVKMERAIHTFL